MAKFKISKEVGVGVFALIAIAILYIGFNFLKGIEFFSRTDKYYAIYEDVAGLSISNPVTINGVSVGRVSDVKIDQTNNNRILVELDVTEDIILGQGSTALLQIDLLGGVSIVLDVGNIQNPVNPGDTIQAKVDPTLTELLEESALPIADNLQVTIRRLNNVLERMASDTSSLNMIIKNIERITYRTDAMIAENRQGIKESVDNFKNTSEKLDSTLEQLSALMTKFGTVADSLSNIQINSALAEANVLLEEMTKAIQQLTDDSGTLGRLMTDDSLYVNLNKAIVDLDKLLIHMNENPKHFFAPLGKSKKKIEKDLAKQSEN